MEVKEVAIWERKNRLDAEMEKQNNEELYGSKMEEKIKSQVIGVEEEDDDMDQDKESHNDAGSILLYFFNQLMLS